MSPDRSDFCGSNLEDGLLTAHQTTSTAFQATPSSTVTHSIHPAVVLQKRTPLPLAAQSCSLSSPSSPDGARRRRGSQMENPRDPRRAQSLDRSHAPRKDSESSSCQCLSLPGTPCRRAPRRAVSDWVRYPQGLSPSPGPKGAEADAAHSLEETRGFLSSEQKQSPDISKDKAQRWAQPGFLKTVLNFFLRTGIEEPKDKASRRPKGKEETPEPLEASEELALRKKAQDKKASRKKYGHRKHGAEEAKGNHDWESAGHEALLPKMAAVSHSEEAEVGTVCRGGRHPSGSPFLSSEGATAGPLGVSPQATGPGSEEEPMKPDQDAVIRMIVEFLKKVGDQWQDEQLAAPQSEVLFGNPPAPACRRKSPEKKPSSSVKRAFSLRKGGPEDPRRARAADVPTPEARPPKGPSFLPLCVRGAWPSTSSSPGSEGPGAHQALSVDGRSPQPPERPARVGCQGPEEELPLDRASEYSEFMRRILALLHGAEEPAGAQPQVQEAGAAVESPAPACRGKSQEKKPSSLRRAFSHKRHSAKEPKGVGTTTPEPRPPKRPSFLPLCVGGSDADGPEFREPRAAEGAALGSLEAASQPRSCTPDAGPQPEGAHESKKLIICKLVALLQEVDGELGTQIQRHPSFESFFYEFSDASLRKLVAALRSQKAHAPGGDGGLLPQRRFPLALGVGHKYTGGHSRSICSLMGSRGHFSPPSDDQSLSKEADPSLTSPECQSPD